MRENSFAIRFEGVAKSYPRPGRGRLEVLASVDLDLPRGALVLLEGPSGSGKTTLLNLAGGMTRATRGRIIVEGETISDLPEVFLARFRRETIGFVFQGQHLLDRITALENVALPLVPLGLPRNERTRRAAELLDRFGLSDRAGFRTSNLSGGERQRVAIARSLVLSPKILIADEPLTGLDPETAFAVLDLLEKAREEGKTVLAAAHGGLPGLDMPPDLVIRLENGRITTPAV